MQHFVGLAVAAFITGLYNTKNFQAMGANPGLNWKEIAKHGPMMLAQLWGWMMIMKVIFKIIGWE